MCHEVFGGLEADAAVHLSKTFSVDRDEMVVEEKITPLSLLRPPPPVWGWRPSPLFPVGGGG